MTRPVTPHMAVHEVTLTSVTIEYNQLWDEVTGEWVLDPTKARMTISGKAGKGEVIAYVESMTAPVNSLPQSVKDAAFVVYQEGEKALQAQVERNISADSPA